MHRLVSGYKGSVWAFVIAALEGVDLTGIPERDTVERIIRDAGIRFTVRTGSESPRTVDDPGEHVAATLKSP